MRKAAEALFSRMALALFFTALPLLLTSQASAQTAASNMTAKAEEIMGVFQSEIYKASATTVQTDVSGIKWLLATLMGINILSSLYKKGPDALLLDLAKTGMWGFIAVSIMGGSGYASSGLGSALAVSADACSPAPPTSGLSLDRDLYNTAKHMADELACGMFGVNVNKEFDAAVSKMTVLVTDFDTVPDSCKGLTDSSAIYNCVTAAKAQPAVDACSTGISGIPCEIGRFTSWLATGLVTSLLEFAYTVTSLIAVGAQFVLMFTAILGVAASLLMLKLICPFLALDSTRGKVLAAAKVPLAIAFYNFTQKMMLYFFTSLVLSVTNAATVCFYRFSQSGDLAGSVSIRIMLIVAMLAVLFLQIAIIAKVPKIALAVVNLSLTELANVGSDMMSAGMAMVGGMAVGGAMAGASVASAGAAALSRSGAAGALGGAVGRAGSSASGRLGGRLAAQGGPPSGPLAPSGAPSAASPSSGGQPAASTAPAAPGVIIGQPGDNTNNAIPLRARPGGAPLAEGLAAQAPGSLAAAGGASLSAPAPNSPPPPIPIVDGQPPAPALSASPSAPGPRQPPATAATGLDQAPAASASAGASRPAAPPASAPIQAAAPGPGPAIPETPSGPSANPRARRAPRNSSGSDAPKTFSEWEKAEGERSLSQSYNAIADTIKGNFGSVRGVGRMASALAIGGIKTVSSLATQGLAGPGTEINVAGALSAGSADFMGALSRGRENYGKFREGVEKEAALQRRESDKASAERSDSLGEAIKNGDKSASFANSRLSGPEYTDLMANLDGVISGALDAASQLAVIRMIEGGIRAPSEAQDLELQEKYNEARGANSRFASRAKQVEQNSQRLESAIAYIAQKIEISPEDVETLKQALALPVNARAAAAYEEQRPILQALAQACLLRQASEETKN